MDWTNSRRDAVQVDEQLLYGISGTAPRQLVLNTQPMSRSVSGWIALLITIVRVHVVCKDRDPRTRIFVYFGFADLSFFRF